MTEVLSYYYVKLLTSCTRRCYSSVRDRKRNGEMSKPPGTILDRPAGPAGAARATPLGFGVRPRPAAGRRTQIDRADGGTPGGGECASDAAVDWAEPLGLGTGLATLGATHDSGTGPRA